MSSEYGISTDMKGFSVPSKSGWIIKLLSPQSGWIIKLLSPQTLSFWNSLIFHAPITEEDRELKAFIKPSEAP